MPYTKEHWKSRIANRTDMCTGLVHLTRETDQMNVHDVLLKILVEQKLLGSSTESGFICGNRKAVCFQDTPLYSISQNVYYEQKQKEQNDSYKVRYRAFGLMFSKDYLFSKGARPVIYEKTTAAKDILPRDEWWRIVSFDISDSSNFIDWTHEREWRLADKLTFRLSDATLLVPKYISIKILSRKYNDETGKSLIDELGGIVTLGNVLF